MLSNRPWLTARAPGPAWLTASRRASSAHRVRDGQESAPGRATKLGTWSQQPRLLAVGALLPGGAERVPAAGSLQLSWEPQGGWRPRPRDNALVLRPFTLTRPLSRP